MTDTSNERKSMNGKGAHAALLLFFLLAYLLPLGARDLVLPDETRYAEIPREMIASGDWIVPRLNGLRYFEKPVLGYWVHAASQLVLGENNFAVRLPSALAVGLSALLIYGLASRVSRRKDADGDATAVLAALVFLSAFEVFGVGNTAVLDNLFSVFLTACLTAFYFASEAPPKTAKESGFLLLAGLFCGLAFLTKGFLAFAVPVLSLAPYLVWQRRYGDLLRMSWLPILTAVVVALPWSIAIHLKEPDFWRFFFWHEHIQRFAAQNAQHKESFWFFFVLAPAMFIPWTFVLPAAASGIRERLFQHEGQSRLLRFCLCWLIGPFLFLSLSNGKLLTYILPCFPPFAILTAFGLFQALAKDKSNRWFQGGVAVGTLVFGLILVAFLYVQLFGFNALHPYQQSWKAVMVVNGLSFFILFCFWALKSREGKNKIFIFGMAPLLLFFLVHFTIPDQTIEAKSPGQLLEQHAPDVANDHVVISDETSIGAVCWYLRRSDVYLLGGAGELDYGLEYEDAKKRALDTKAAADLVERNRGKTILVARGKRISGWRDQLPQPVFQDQGGSSGYVFWKY